MIGVDDAAVTTGCCAGISKLKSSCFVGVAVAVVAVAGVAANENSSLLIDDGCTKPKSLDGDDEVAIVVVDTLLDCCDDAASDVESLNASNDN